MCAAVCFLCTGCDDDISTGKMIPHTPIGLIIEVDQFGLMWVDGPIAADMYNVYRKIDDGSYEKINPEPVGKSRMFDIPSAPIGLWFVDTDFDIESTSLHSYYVVAATSHGVETEPSELITFVPADMDPTAALTGLIPNKPYRVGLNPTFSWDTVQGAASYCVVLLEESPRYGDVLKWVYRTDGPPVTLESTEGVTYQDGMGASLQPNTDYSWGVFAINSQNAGVAVTFIDFSTGSFVATVMDEEQPAGVGTVYWDQIDYNGLQAPAGSYELRFTAADYDTTLDFEITASAGVAAADQSGDNQVPTSTSVWMESYTHTLGTPIEIRFELPEETIVQMRVFAK
jgi:hypothetical protein